jgi:DsbC/DsbD-like thiol-disulfide interchange protein
MCWKTRLKHTAALTALAASLFGGAGAPVQAETLDGVISARILPGWQTAQGGRIGGLQLTLAPGWKTYWRAPGDAGIPPQFDWRGSGNLAEVQVHWPRPEVKHINGMRTIAYTGEVILPLEVTALRPGQPVTLEAEIAIGVCEEICMPVTLRVSARLDGTGAPDGRISAALEARPRVASARIVCTITPIRDGMALSARIEMPRLGGEETVVIEPSDTRIWVSEANSARKGGALVASADLVPPQAKPFALDRSGLRFTVIGKNDAVEVKGCTGG